MAQFNVKLSNLCDKSKPNLTRWLIKAHKAVKLHFLERYSIDFSDPLFELAESAGYSEGLLHCADHLIGRNTGLVPIDHFDVHRVLALDVGELFFK